MTTLTPAAAAAGYQYDHNAELPIAPAGQQRRIGDFTAGAICLFAFAVLFPMTALDPYPATIVVGTGSLLAVAAALYTKYHGRLALNLEVAFVLGVALQYIFGPLGIRVITDNFDWGSGMTGARYAVKEVYGQAMLMALLFIAVYFFGSSLFAVRAPTRRLDGRLNLLYSQRTILVMAALAVMLWITRANLLASGSFYHIHRTRFQFEDARYSGWAQYDSGVGPLVLSFVWGALFVRKIPAWVAIGYSIIDIGWNFSSGGRERTVISFLVILLTYVIYRNRIPWRAILISVLPFVFLIGFMDYYRYALQRTTDATSISVSGISEALSTAQRQSSTAGMKSVVYRGLSRINDVESIAVIYQNTGSSQPFLNGETYARTLWALVPRALWPEKPMAVVPINEWYFRHEGGSSPITTPGEGYLNYGWPGVILAGLMVSLLVRFADWFLMGRLWNVAVLPIYIGCLAIYARAHTQAICVWVPTLIKMLFLATMVHLLTRPNRALLATADADDDHAARPTTDHAGYPAYP